jgi:hypothetical protein
MADVFPRRNLPPLAEQWGREVENRVVSSEGAIESLQQGLSGQNRNTASSLAVIAQQIQGLADVVAAIPIQMTELDRVSGISATSSSFETKASVTVTVPDGKTTASVLGIGAARITDTVTGGLTSSDARVVISGGAGGSFPAAKDAAVSQVINVLNAQHARTFSVTPGDTFTVAIQVSALNSSAFPANAANFAQISAIANFT